MGWRWELKEKYRDKRYPIGPAGRPKTPEREFRDAFMEGFNKPWHVRPGESPVTTTTLHEHETWANVIYP